jgi:hypothetical protein
MQAQAEQPDAHQDARLAQGVTEGIKGSIEQGGRQAPGEQAKILANLGLDGGIHGRDAEHGIGVAQEQHARQGEQDSQPETLLQHIRHFVIATRPCRWATTGATACNTPTSAKTTEIWMPPPMATAARSIELKCPRTTVSTTIMPMDANWAIRMGKAWAISPWAAARNMAHCRMTRERLLRQGPAAGKTGLVDLPQAACFSTI